MTERKKDAGVLSILFFILIAFYSRILFTDMIIRAPDIINEFYWTIKDIPTMGFLDLFRIKLSGADWDPYVNSGHSVGGGYISLAFIFYKNLIFWLLPLPVSIAWFIVLHLFFGACGVYAFCRGIGSSRPAALFAALVFALAPEIASLINAGHVMKIATISYAPWAFFFLEKGFLTRRTVWFMAAAVTLAFQFFNTHWQISYYTCLCIGLYGVIRSLLILRSPGERSLFPLPQLLASNLVVLLFFLSTVSISLIPLYDWSKDTNRGSYSGANQGKGGLNREEAMMWSMPPEELAGFIIPGFFGLSRQEAGENPKNITSYYWGRMVFTQTASYMGLLPWILAPLPFIFRRDRYTLLAIVAIVGGVLFSMGKYTPFYNLLYDYFPGINRFRVPKMMLFIPVLGLSLLAARGMDTLRDQLSTRSERIDQYLRGVTLIPLFLWVLYGIEWLGRGYFTTRFFEILVQPTRYEQGIHLVGQRYGNLMTETLLAAALATVIVGSFWLFRWKARWNSALLLILGLLYLGDVWRVDDKFMFLVPAPEHRSVSRGNQVTDFLRKGTGDQYRVLPLTGEDPMFYVSQKIPVVFTSNAVQQKRWQDYLDNLALASSMSDILNIKYVVTSADEFPGQKGMLGEKFVPVFTSPDGSQLVLENREVLPKAWLVPAVLPVSSPEQALLLLRHPLFNPRKFALVEAPPPISLPMPTEESLDPGRVTVTSYRPEEILLDVDAATNGMLVMGDKYYRGWQVSIDGKRGEIQRVNYLFRGVAVTPGKHRVEFVFAPLPFTIGKWLTLSSFLLFAMVLGYEMLSRRSRPAA
ncbi:MAG: YfhO family protein [Desulfuromonadia bacterium]